jgi:alpha-L-rhamnosidase
MSKPRCAMMTAFVCLVVVGSAFGSDTLNANYLRCEYLVNPTGIDVTNPRLSWLLESSGRGRKQAAYQVLVATSEEKLAASEGDLWNSGVVGLDRAVHVVYRGRPLTSRMTCWWKVRAWDQDDQPGPWSEPARWTMGLLEPSDWRASWIGYDEPHPEKLSEPEPILLDENSWVALPDARGDRSCYYRKIITVRADKRIVRARYLGSSANQFTLYINGTKAGASDGRHGARSRPALVYVTECLAPGANAFAIAASSAGDLSGVIGKLRIDYADGSAQTENIDTSWKATDTAQRDDEWKSRDFDDSAWSDVREVGKAGDRKWGKFRIPDGIIDIPACPYLRRSFPLDKKVEKAVVYATALGLYELRINGEKVGEDVFAPGWTDYNKRVYYQTYDVTDLLRRGENALGVVLGHGWYSGHLGWNLADRGQYGKNPRALVQLEVHFTDGTATTVVTDDSWRAAHGPILGADFYMGEVYDARKERPGWDRPGYDESGWRPVVVQQNVDAKVEAYPGVPVRKIMELKPKSVSEPEPGAFVYDLGQNMVGWARLKVKGDAGTKITLRFAEMLNPDGTLYVENLRGARCIDEYWLRGGQQEIWEPRFTFHGFRYVEVTGYPGRPPLDAVTGVVVHSDMAPTGRFETSHKLLNQLQSNIQWGQRGNFLEVPTDCPQRDERLGWMGDAQVFCRTACFNMDTAAFFTKWMQDIRDAQLPNGAFSDVTPRIVVMNPGSPAWADAGVIIPWTIYQCFGDRRIIEESYDAMQAWIRYMGEDNPDYIRRKHLNNNYGDWLFKGQPTPKDLIATAFYGYSTRLLADMAAVIGKADDARKYEELFQNIKRAFTGTYVDADGRIEADTQTAYVLALHFDLLPDDLRAKAARHLVNAIEESDWHITTGFVGGPYITETLTNAGYLDVAYRLLLNETYPSWLYPVTQGATTIWERWDGWRHDGGFQDPGMNSFNHYAYGAVGAWMYEDVAGIGTDEPGYKHIIIRPRPGDGLTYARAEYDSIRGTIVSDWRVADGSLVLNVEIPVNTTATVYIPTENADRVTESGVPAEQAECVEFRGTENGAAVFEIGSGRYEFKSPWNR